MTDDAALTCENARREQAPPARRTAVIRLGGHEYGTAAEVAAALTSADRTITADRVWDWGRRAAIPGDPLYGLLPRHHRRGRAWYRLDQAAEVERVTRRPVPA